MKPCAQKLDVTDPMVLASTCTEYVLEPSNERCYYHTKLLLELCTPAHPGAYGLGKKPTLVHGS